MKGLLLSITLFNVLAVTTAAKRFAFRQDGFQDWYQSYWQVHLLNFFMDRGIPVTASVFGGKVTGADKTLLSALKRCVSLGADKCGLSNYGVDASYTYDQANSSTVAYNHMKVADDKIHTLFPGYTIETFVPYQNAWNEYTLEAAKLLGYSAVSASVQNYSMLAYNTSSDPLQLSQHTQTGDYISTGAWIAHPIEKSVAECEKASAKGEVCVILTQPYEFSTGAYTWTMLQYLVNNLTALGYKGVNFHSIIQEVKEVPIPSAAPTHMPSGKHFAFRQDGVEDWYNSKQQIELLSFFMDRGIPVSAGITGNFVTGDDTALYAALQRCVNLGPLRCSLHNRGADATFLYNEATSTDEAYTHMKSCDDKIKLLFPGYQVQTFVPYRNLWNEYTLLAVQQIGYKAISASTSSYSNLTYSVNKNPLQLSQQTQTGDYVSTGSGSWAAHPIQQTVEECEAASARGETCVILTQPYEFAAGVYNLTMLEYLVGNLTARGYTGVNFNTIIDKETVGWGQPTFAPTYINTIAPTVEVTAAPTYRTAGKRYTFRQDSVEDWYNSEIQVKLLTYFMDRKIPFTASIIGDFFTGTDVPLFTALRRCVSMGADKCALGNQGSDATFTFDKANSTADAYNRMKKCDDRIKLLFPGYTVETFVPYRNLWNEYTLEAAKQLGYFAVSASTHAYSNLTYDVTNIDPLQLSQQTQTGDYLDSGSWAAHSIEETMADCEEATARGEVCVIMIQPYEFAAGVYNFTMLDYLIGNLTDAGYAGVNFHTIIQQVLAPTPVPTAIPTYYPSSLPSTVPSGSPSQEPSSRPSSEPTSIPTVRPTKKPTPSPTADPSQTPSYIPSANPTYTPTYTPTANPSFIPSANPSFIPSASPSYEPSSRPSSSPTSIPTARPTFRPTKKPTPTPTADPTRSPTRDPTYSPTASPSTVAPTVQPSTRTPTFSPTAVPSLAPTTFKPSPRPTKAPTTRSPTILDAPTAAPTVARRYSFVYTNLGTTNGTITQADILNFFLDNNMAISAGVVIDDLSTNQTELYTALMRCVGVSKNNCSIFLQDVDSSSSGRRLATSSVDEIKSQILAKVNKIKSLFGVTVNVYSPPSDTIDDNTRQALKELGFAAISAPASQDISYNVNIVPKQLVQQTSTGLISNGTWTANPADAIVATCVAAAERGEACLIRVTPEEFITSAYSSGMLTDLVGSMIDANFVSPPVNLETVINQADSSTSSTSSNSSTGPKLASYFIVTIVFGGLVILAVVFFFYRAEIIATANSTSAKAGAYKRNPSAEIEFFV